MSSGEADQTKYFSQECRKCKGFHTTAEHDIVALKAQVEEDKRTWRQIVLEQNEYFASVLSDAGWIVLPPSSRKVRRISRLEIITDPVGISFRWIK